MENKKVKVAFNVFGELQIYRGELIEENDSFIKIIDIKLGEIQLRRSHIISIRPWKDFSNHVCKPLYIANERNKGYYLCDMQSCKNYMVWKDKTNGGDT